MEARYLAIDVSTAPPLSLVARLLARSLQHLRDARGAQSAAARTRALSRALDILGELRRALDFEAGGEVARNLDRLYDFATERLVLAGVSANAGEIDQALEALTPIAEAFSQLAGASPAEVAE